jgi:hypothetical protein
MSYIEDVLGANVLEDWDNFFETKLKDYYTTKEKLDGWWFTLRSGVVQGENAEVITAVGEGLLPIVVKVLRKPSVFVGVLIGPGINGNPYNLTERQTYVVDVFDETSGMFYTAQGVVSLMKKLNNNPYKAKFSVVPIIGVIDFKAATAALEALDGEDNTEVQTEVHNSLNMLLDQPSGVNPAVTRKGVICQGLFGYTFHHE